MNILITGARGFIGRNLSARLQALRDGQDKTRPGLLIDAILEYDLNSPPEALSTCCAQADFVFHLAGVNRPKDSADFTRGNVSFTQTLLDCLNTSRSKATVLFSSSAQAAMTGRYAGSVYGQSKREGEALLLRYAEETGNPVLIYRFPNVAGKWARPHYNSVVATFCHQIANDLPIQMDDPSVELELLFIDDLVEEMLDALEGRPHRCEPDGRYCQVPVTHRITLARLAELLYTFHDQPDTLLMPALPPGSLEKKLYATYLSYLPEHKTAYPLRMNVDDRGSFTELIRTADHGQFSVNIAKPGVTKGQHWHHAKWELFIVVSGEGLIRQQQIGTDEAGHPYPIREYRVSGQKLQAVHMLPGYTHSITNLSATDDLITVMWASEPFDPDHPDTYFEPV
ncbi:MAG: NAD-dependent epimerase/dehydratase family protein [Clostridia bacterium]|nr:NAD-dependent epimerase/dehydratase family protein [Clostridia bacterium]